MKELYGTPVSGGIVLGPAVHWRADIPVPPPTPLTANSVDAALTAHDRTRKQVEQDLLRQMEKAGPSSSRYETLQSQIEDIVNDADFNRLVCGEITERYVSPDRAVYELAFQKIETLYRKLDRAVKGQASYWRAVLHRYLHTYAGNPPIHLANLVRPCIIVAKKLKPQQLVDLDVANTLGFITEEGTFSCHAAIMAREYGIPAIMGVANALNEIGDNAAVLVDTTSGTISTNLDAIKYHFMEQEQRRLDSPAAKPPVALHTKSATKTVTTDGARVRVGLSLGAVGTENAVVAAQADNIGLYRSEFLFLKERRPPGEEMQYEQYRRVLARHPGKTVTVRTIDFSEDKKPTWFDAYREDNRHVAKQGLRLALDNPQLFLTQLRAVLRASHHGNVRLAFPLVADVGEYFEALALLDEAKKQLAAQRIPYDKALPTGPIIELPSAAVLADSFAREADFALIGSNDLCQYLLAADRADPAVSLYYQLFHPVMFRTIASVHKAFNARGKRVTLCGELANDPRATPVLLGIGIRDLSVSPAYLSLIQRRISGASLVAMQTVAIEALQLQRTEDIVELLQEAMP